MKMFSITAKPVTLFSRENWNEWEYYIRFKCDAYIWSIVDLLIANNDAVQPMARFLRPELPAESRTRITADEAAMAGYDKLRMYYFQDLREFILENDKLVAFKDEVYSTVSQAFRELLLPIPSNLAANSIAEVHTYEGITG
jgi:hypothetical protein